ncbi:MAG: glucose-6-phosphate isomerase [Hyphomicrobiaceae bacterium]
MGVATRTVAWARVRDVHARMGGVTLRQLFDAPAGRDRFQLFSRTACDLLVDVSKQRLQPEALEALFQLAAACGVESSRDAMVEGAPINATEARPARHIALRAASGDPSFADVADLVAGERARMLAFAAGVRSGALAAADGTPFTDVIHLGIGGSDLGPQLANQALRPYRSGPRVHFVSNVDGAHLADTLADLNAERTLVVVASKSFTTAETMLNARTARSWIAAAVGEANIGAHFAALSTNRTAVEAFGITADRMFGFWDWVGGRFSLWSSIGLPIALACGPDAFGRLLAGARAMDDHFRTAPLDQNVPVLLALVGVWNRNVEGHETLAVIPYDQRLQRFPAYLQQLEMESNGKRVMASGARVEGHTAPIVWGEPGTNAQHAFFQLLHQGTTIVPVDFLVAAAGHEPELAAHHTALVANCLAQSEALMRGETQAAVEARLIARGLSTEAAKTSAPHRVFPGNRPSTTIVYPKLTPEVLGQLIALYEHKVFVQGLVWGINSFDQMGVELGKTLAGELAPMVAGEAVPAGRDASTLGLLAAVARLTGRARTG